MDDASKVDPKSFTECMKIGMNSYLESVTQAVNIAPDGEQIAASEEQLWDFSAEFCKRVFG